MILKVSFTIVIQAESLTMDDDLKLFSKCSLKYTTTHINNRRHDIQDSGTQHNDIQHNNN
jgi:hypothetical protein